MSIESIALTLFQMDDSKIAYIVKCAMRAWAKTLYAVVDDIYDSCIKDYYAGYTPTSYTRHGNIEGYNLYDAPVTSLTSGELLFDEDPYQLEPYGKTREYRPKVLHNVLNGLRGTGMRSTQEDWPMEWHTKYPNHFSKYNIWTSSGHTIKEIIRDFEDNVLDDTEDLFWGFVEQLI